MSIKGGLWGGGISGREKERFLGVKTIEVCYIYI
jgi:hypothetical protein